MPLKNSEAINGRHAEANSYESMDIRVSIPVVVVGVNIEEGAEVTVNVIPSYKKRNQLLDGQPGTQEYIETVPIEEVPVQFPMTAFGFLSIPLAPGDRGLLVFNDWDLEGWKVELGGTYEPKNFQNHDLNDCFFIPGVYPKVAPSREYDPEFIRLMTSDNQNGFVIGGGCIDMVAGGQSFIDAVDAALGSCGCAPTGFPKC